MKGHRTKIAVIASFCCLLMAGATTVGDTKDPYAPAIRIAREQLEAMRARSHTPSVSVAVMHRGRLLFSEAFGYADLEQKVKAAPATRFGIGSVTKALTAVAAVSLERDGALDLDSPLESYLPDFPHAGKGVTIRTILTHTSGLDDAFARENYWTTNPFTITEAAERIGRDGLAFAPGEKFMYATGSFTLVGAAMEQAADEPFERIIFERVLEPSGMIDTVVNSPRPIIPNRTRFYLSSDSDGKPENAPTYDPTHKLPGAGYLSTATDLARFGDALQAGKLIDSRGMSRLFAEATTSDGKPNGYALGFQHADDAEHGRVYHLPGGGPGISAWLMLYTRYGMTFAILSNMTSAPVGGSEFGKVQEAFLCTARDLKAGKDGG